MLWLKLTPRSISEKADLIIWNRLYFLLCYVFLWIWLLAVFQRKGTMFGKLIACPPLLCSYWTWFLDNFNEKRIPWVEIVYFSYLLCSIYYLNRLYFSIVSCAPVCSPGIDFNSWKSEKVDLWGCNEVDVIFSVKLSSSHEIIVSNSVW